MVVGTGIKWVNLRKVAGTMLDVLEVLDTSRQSEITQPQGCLKAHRSLMIKQPSVITAELEVDTSRQGSCKLVGAH